MKLSGLALVAIGAALAGAATVAVGVARGAATVEDGHTPIHIGCAHHNHGLKWHENHGRVLGQPASRFTRSGDGNPADNLNDDVVERSLTFGR